MRRAVLKTFTAPLPPCHFYHHNTVKYVPLCVFLDVVKAPCFTFFPAPFPLFSLLKVRSLFLPLSCFFFLFIPPPFCFNYLCIHVIPRSTFFFPSPEFFPSPTVIVWLFFPRNFSPLFPSGKQRVPRWFQLFLIFCFSLYALFRCFPPFPSALPVEVVRTPHFSFPHFFALICLVSARMRNSFFLTPSIFFFPFSSFPLFPPVPPVVPYASEF